MKPKFTWLSIITLGLILIGMPLLYAEEEEPSQADVAYQEAVQDRMADLEEIAANRDAVMEEIVGTWSADANGWQEQFSINVSMADDSKLLALRNAVSFDEVITILDGNTPELLGDPSADLVYTPVTPCKIVDTRSGGGGFISAGSTRHYQTYGPLGAQGGSNCSSPRGEPSAVHISMVAVNPDGKGNLKAHPFGTPSNRGLSINFAPIGTNLAIAGTVGVTRNSFSDISISANFSGAHVVAPVLGYYYPVDRSDYRVRVSGNQSSNATNLTGSPTGGPCTNHSGGTVYLVAPGPGWITVTAQAWLRLESHNSSTIADQMWVHIGTTPSECIFARSEEGYHAMPWNVAGPAWTAASQHEEVSVSRTFQVHEAGIKRYYLNGKRFGGTGTMGFWGSAMQAHYYPNPNF